MTQMHSEEDIQTMLASLRASNPELATREAAIEALERLRNLAKTVVDKVDEDVSSGRLTVDDDGEVTRSEEATQID